MDRYKPKKHQNPVKAIRELCIECMGGRDNESYTKLIADCPSSNCPVFSFRFGKNPYHKQNLSPQQRNVLSQRGRDSSLIRLGAGKSTQI